MYFPFLAKFFTSDLHFLCPHNLKIFLSRLYSKYNDYIKEQSRVNGTTDTGDQKVNFIGTVDGFFSLVPIFVD